MSAYCLSSLVWRLYPSTSTVQNYLRTSYFWNISLFMLAMYVYYVPTKFETKRSFFHLENSQRAVWGCHGNGIVPYYYGMCPNNLFKFNCNWWYKSGVVKCVPIAKYQLYALVQHDYSQLHLIWHLLIQQSGCEHLEQRDTACSLAEPSAYLGLGARSQTTCNVLKCSHPDCWIKRFQIKWSWLYSYHFNINYCLGIGVTS